MHLRGSGPKPCPPVNGTSTAAMFKRAIRNIARFSPRYPIGRLLALPRTDWSVTKMSQKGIRGAPELQDANFNRHLLILVGFRSYSGVALWCRYKFLAGSIHVVRKGIDHYSVRHIPTWLAGGIEGSLCKHKRNRIRPRHEVSPQATGGPRLGIVVLTEPRIACYRILVTWAQVLPAIIVRQPAFDGYGSTNFLDNPMPSRDQEIYRHWRSRRCNLSAQG